VERSVGPGAKVVAWRRLTGGITASMHRLTVEMGTDRVETFVLRRWLFDDEERLLWARSCLARESAALAGLAETGVPAPRLVAWSDGRESGVPALLMTRVPGRMNLAPRNPAAWVKQIGSALPAIHAAEINAPDWQPWIDPDTYEVPAWSRRPEVWRAAIDAVRDAMVEPGPTCFIHRDYQHFNLLWSRERLTAVVDWANAATGPPDIDVGHCRLNLAVLFSAELAEEFHSAYQAAAGRSVDPRWDLMSLLSYDQEWKGFIPVQVHGRAPVDLVGMDQRVEDTIAAVVARL
jgi:aminoglycoside phosphotransferase (APT) family kinase protein